MHKIFKSLLPTEEHVNSFQRLCNKQIDEMRAHKSQMEMVKKDPKNYHPYPPPEAHPDIMAAIVKDGDDYNIEFELIEDELPTLSLDEKKQSLISKMNDALQAMQSRLLPPPLKMRLANIELDKAYKLPIEKRTADQLKMIDDREMAIRELDKINHQIAIAESDIHDLTEFNIDQYKLPEFAQ